MRPFRFRARPRRPRRILPARRSAHRAALAAVAIATLALGAAAPIPAAAAPEAELWERWTANDPDAGLAVDHSAWDRLLERYVHRGDDGVNRFDYAAVSRGDRQALSRYIDALAGVSISRYRRAEQRAFWINLYNALTVRVVLDHYPVDSITDIDISPGLFANGPWGKKLVEVEGEAISLDDIEHRILRPIWNDPRIHYAVNCAALGCPNLRADAFTAANTESMLDSAARAYVNHPRGARFDDDALIVSSIYEWFQSDFGGSDAGVIAHLKRYAEPALAARLERADRIAEDRYDWSLNDAR